MIQTLLLEVQSVPVVHRRSKRKAKIIVDPATRISESDREILTLKMWRKACGQVRPEADIAQDALQEARIEAWRRAKTWDDRSWIRWEAYAAQFVFRVAQHHMLRAKKLDDHDELPIALATPETKAERTYTQDQRDRLAIAQRAIKGLDAPLRAVAELYWVQGMTVDEITRIALPHPRGVGSCRLTARAIQKRLERAKALIKERIEP